MGTRIRSTHDPFIVPRPKMDTPTGLYGGACVCGWRSGGIESESRAWASARQHVRDKQKGIPE